MGATAAEQCLAATSFDRLPVVHDDLPCVEALEPDRSVDATAAEQGLAAASFDRPPIVHDDLLALGAYTLTGLFMPPPPNNALLQRASTFSQSLMFISLRLGVTA